MPLQNLSRKAIVGLLLVICYAPFSWVIFIPDRWLWIKLWPILPGMMLADLLRFCLNQFRVEIVEWLRMPLCVICSVGPIVGIMFLLFHIPRWRLVVAILVLVVMVFLSMGAYGAYRA